MSNKLYQLAVGVSGFASTEVAPELVNVVTNEPSQLAQVLVQIIIGIVTLIGLFKKKDK